MSDMLNFPRQMLPFSRKTKEWRKNCLLWANQKTFFNYSLVRKSVIHKKIASINNILQNIQDGLPSVSLSVGVAFSDCGYDDVLETQADEALYKVKKGGRCNCSFYKNNSNNI